MEKRCVHALYQFWCSKGMDVGALIRDGLHVSTEAQPEHLAAASIVVYDRLVIARLVQGRKWEGICHECQYGQGGRNTTMLPPGYDSVHGKATVGGRLNYP